MYPIKIMCKVLGLNRSTYYKVSTRTASQREQENQKLDQEILNFYYNTKCRYGAPKIYRCLLQNNWTISLKRVQRRMSYLGIRSIVVKKYRHCASTGSVSERINILQQDFSATNINQKWCTDITYVHTTQDGWTYLASVMDLYSKKIIGWSFGNNLTAELAVRAVKNACLNVATPEGIVLHSDLGSQYTSALFEIYLAKKKIQHSYSRKGYPYDNACIESFHSILKKEEVNRCIYKDYKEAHQSLFEYIESWYNHKRIHSSIGYKTPDSIHAGAVS